MSRPSSSLLFVALSSALIPACAVEVGDAVGVQSEAVCAAPHTLRVVTANMAHLSTDWLRDSAIDAGAPATPDPLESVLVGGVTALADLELVGQANAFALQEVDRHRDQSLGINWPLLIDLFLGAGGGVCSDYSYLYGTILGGEWLTGNALFTNALASGIRIDLNVGCDPGGPPRYAPVSRLAAGETDVWVMDVHLAVCRTGVAENECNFQRMLSFVDLIDEDDVVIVTGDFNATRSADPTGVSHPACSVENRREQFSYILGELQRRGFMDVAPNFIQGRLTHPVDHLFVRDPHFQLHGVSARWVAPTAYVDEAAPEVRVSDHAWMVTDVRLSGPGMSPNFVPIMAAL